MFAASRSLRKTSRAARLLQSLTVRPVFDDGGAETGMVEVPAGGRRYRCA
jgi:hypothetical protein